jgi:hypothetical protein
VHTKETEAKSILPGAERHAATAAAAAALITASSDAGKKIFRNLCMLELNDLGGRKVCARWVWEVRIGKSTHIVVVGSKIGIALHRVTMGHVEKVTERNETL